MKTIVIKWRNPKQGWYKCNADDTYRGNPSASSISFYIRNEKGDFVYALCRQLQDSIDNA